MKLDVEQKFAKALVRLRKERPFYSAIYESLERIEENDKVDTIGVNTKQIVYNSKFIDELPFEEFMFINLHEIVHVALMHVSRQENRDHTLWNIACDLYVNALLAAEFNIQPGEIKYDIKMPVNGCYCSSIDLETDCAEHIYDCLYKQASSNGYNEALQEYKNGEFKFNYKGTLNSKDGHSEFNISVNTECAYGDIIESGADSMLKESENKQVLSDAKTRYEMQSGGYGCGDGSGMLAIKVNNILKSHIDWRKWLKKYCIQAKSSDSSFSNPDKRMFYQDAIYPGQALNDCNSIKGIKICIDTSGSISDDDLRYIFGQVLSLTKTFKIEAELIAWDTVAESCGELRNTVSVSELNLCGGGGTDPSCVFKYFDSKKCKTKPLVTLMFTDGYWNMNKNTKWAKKYKDTLWVLTRGAYDGFKPPFGLKAKVKY